MTHEVLQDQAGEEYREIASRTQSEYVRSVANALARATDRDERSRSECTEALRRATRVYDGSSLACRENLKSRLTLSRRRRLEIRMI